MSIEFIDHSSNLILNVEPVLTDDNYVSVGPYKIKASFDFSEMPDKYHQTALQMILQGRTHLSAPVYTTSTYEISYKDEEVDNSLLGKFFSLFKRKT